MAAITYTGPGTFAVGIWDISHPGHPVLDATAGQNTPIQFLGPSTLLTGASGRRRSSGISVIPQASDGRLARNRSDHTRGQFGHTVWAEPDSHLVELWGISGPSAPVHEGTLTFDFDGDADSAELVSYQTITSATFVPDTAALAVESQSDSSVFFIDANQSALVGQLCQYAGAPMSAAQWITYAPGVPYQQPCS